MINFDVVKENIKEHNPNWPQISDHPYRILIIGGSGSGKTNSLFNLTNHQPDIDKIYLYAKDPYEAKYQILIKKREDVGIKHFNDSKTFILTGEEILPPNQRRVIEQAKFAYSPLGKAFEKQTKPIEDQGKKQIKTTEDHGKQSAKSNELIRKGFNTSISFDEQKKNT